MAGEVPSIWRVIFASSVGTMIEWYDFYFAERGREHQTENLEAASPDGV